MLLALPQTDFDRILDDPKLAGATVSAYVCRLDGTEIFSRNPAIHVIPASNQKLLTCAFALQTLGESYRPETKIWKERTRTVVSTTGDPLLSHGQLVWARQRLGLDRRLPVWVKQPYAPGVPPTWEHDDLPNRYAAPVTAFTLDRGSFELWYRNGKIQGQPSTYGVKIVRGRTVGPLSVVYDPFAKVAVVNGVLPAHGGRLDTLSLIRPDHEAAGILGSRLVPLAGPEPARKPDWIIRGSSLPSIVARCLKTSDNNVAEQLLLLSEKSLGQFHENVYIGATERMERFLTSTVGVPSGDVNAYDGSGMSRHNFVTTRSLGRLLAWADSQPTGAIWRESLAIAGQPGTLLRRLPGLDFRGKTGTLDQVVALSGYVRRRSGERVVASVVINEYGCTEREARDVVDRFVKRIAAD